MTILFDQHLVTTFCDEIADSVRREELWVGNTEFDGMRCSVHAWRIQSEFLDSSSDSDHLTLHVLLPELDLTYAASTDPYHEPEDDLCVGTLVSGQVPSAVVSQLSVATDLDWSVLL